MLTIYKYEVTTEFTLQLPTNYEILSVADQHGITQMWVKVDTELPKQDVEFICYGTGHEIDPELNLKFIDTFPAVGGMFIFHLFQVL